MSANNFSQIPVGSRINPANQRPKGRVINWEDSILSVRCMCLHDDLEPAEYVFDADTEGGEEILVFGQDYPVIFRAFSFVATAVSGVVLRAPLFEANNFVSGYVVAGNALYVPSPLQSLPLYEKEAAYGVTITNGVATSGYPFLLNSYVSGVSDQRLEIDIVTEGSLHGRPNRNFTDINSIEPLDVDQDNVFPCFLLESDYTQAMKDAGNVYQYAWSSGGFNYDIKLYICGIFAEVAIEG
jgi:hypothetical protein